MNRYTDGNEVSALETRYYPFEIDMHVAMGVIFIKLSSGLKPETLLTLSNSSIKQTPRSAKTRAPASNVHSLVTGCR